MIPSGEAGMLANVVHVFVDPLNLKVLDLLAANKFPFLSETRQ